MIIAELERILLPLTTILLILAPATVVGGVVGGAVGEDGVVACALEVTDEDVRAPVADMVHTTNMGPVLDFRREVLFIRQSTPHKGYLPAAVQGKKMPLPWCRNGSRYSSLFNTI
jgi:hypothetical protein